MGAVEMEILHTVGRFDVNACLKSIVLDSDIHIKKSYVFPGEGPNEFDGKDAVEVLQKYIYIYIYIYIYRRSPDR